MSPAGKPCHPKLLLGAQLPAEKYLNTPMPWSFLHFAKAWWSWEHTRKYLRVPVWRWYCIEQSLSFLPDSLTINKPKSWKIALSLFPQCLPVAFLDKTLCLLIPGRIIASIAVGNGKSWLPSVLSSLRLSILSIPLERAEIIYWGKDPH